MTFDVAKIRNASSISHLASVPSELSGLAITLVDGQRIEAGDTRHPLVGCSIALSEEVNASEQTTNGHNRAIAWLLHSAGTLYCELMEVLYDTSGDWAYSVGLPRNSGVGGGLLAVMPGAGAIAAFSPPLADTGNSVRGQRMVAAVAKALGWTLYRVPGLD